MLRTVAIMAVRNERPYLRNCLGHLIDNGIDFYIVDNESTDATLDLLREPHIAEHLVGYERFPFEGAFDWEGLLRAREQAARKVEADWVVFVSADEIMHSYRAGESLAAAIARVDAEGDDVIDFNEYVFLPVDTDYVVDCSGWQPLRHYYFFEPKSPRLMRARKQSLEVSHVAKGGHVLVGGPFKLSAESFALRHYIVRSQAHASRKYTERVFRREEIARGWHAERVDQPPGNFTLPAATELERTDGREDRNLNRAHPRKRHYWQWRDSAAPSLGASGSAPSPGRSGRSGRR